MPLVLCLTYHLPLFLTHHSTPHTFGPPYPLCASPQHVWSDEFHGTVSATPAQQAEQHALTAQLFGNMHAIVAQARTRAMMMIGFAGRTKYLQKTPISCRVSLRKTCFFLLFCFALRQAFFFEMTRRFIAYLLSFNLLCFWCVCVVDTLVRLRSQVKSESDPADAVAGCKALASMLEILAVFRTPVERAQIGQLLIQVR